MRITDQNNTVLDNYDLTIIIEISIFRADYESADSLTIMEDIDMNENRFRELRNPRDANDAVNKRYMNKRIEYETKDLENKFTTVQTQITKIQQQIDGIKPFSSDQNMGNNQIINVGYPRNPEHNIEYENDVVTTNFSMIMLKLLTENT